MPASNHKPSHERLSPAQKDFIALCAIAAVALIIAVGLDLFDRFVWWYVKQEEPWEIEEIIVVIFVLSFFFALFSYRRWKELVREVRAREKIEKASREQAEWLKTLMDTIPNPVFYIDEEGRYSGCNRAFQELTGKSADEIIGRGVKDLCAFTGPDVCCKSMQEEPYRDVQQVCESVAENKDGERRDVILRKAALLDSEGRSSGAVGIITDITEIKQSELALAEESLRRRILFEQSRDGIVVLDETGRVFEANEKYAAMLGYTLDEVYRLHVWDWDAQWTRKELEVIIQEVGRAGDFFETRHRRKDGSVFDVEISSNAAVISGQKFIFCVCRDISQRKAIENELRESDAFIKAVMESLPIGIAVSRGDLFSDFIYMNDNFPKFFRTTREQLSDPRNLWNALASNPGPKRASHRRAFGDGAGGDPESMCWEEVPIIREEDETSYVTMRNTMIPDRNLMISTVWDVSEHKMAEDERKKLQERLQRAEKMEALGTMAGGVAHDLNNVLGVVVGYSELLVYDLDKSSPERAEALEILKAGQRAAAIVQDLLTLARRGVHSCKVLNLNDVLTDCRKSPECAMLRSSHPDIRIEIELDPALLDIAGSSVHLSKSFMNLVANAAEAMPKGGEIRIQTRNEYLDRPVVGYDEVQEGDYAVFSVSDSGEGISPDDLKHIFEPFYTKKIMGRSGTGLGLAVVWGTVKDHRGYINVETEEGKGATFTLYFPVTREAVPPEEVSPSAAEYMGARETILVVDDVKEQRDLAAAMLGKLNYRVTTASGGEEAVQYLKEHPVDLLVLDMIMEPGMDGLETYRQALEIHPGQKAIIVSGFAATDRVSKAQSLGAGTYVKKPYIMEKLGLAVSRELRRKK